MIPWGPAEAPTPAAGGLTAGALAAGLQDCIGTGCEASRGTFVLIGTDVPLDREALQAEASGWMSRDPVCVRPEALATEALRLMEERKITSLPVVDADGRPEGVVHLHDLWRTEMI